MQHPIFVKYTRDWLHRETGYSEGYLCRVATGDTPLSRSFIERACFKLNEREEDLFSPDAPQEAKSNRKEKRVTIIAAQLMDKVSKFNESQVKIMTRFADFLTEIDGGGSNG